MQTDDSENFTKYFNDPKVLAEIEGRHKDYVENGNVPQPEELATSVTSSLHGLPPILSGGDFPPIWELESRPFLVDNLFQRGDTILAFSKPKLGKSFFWGNAAVCLTAGLPFMGKQTTKSNVLVIDLELRRDVAMDRLISIANAHGMEKVPDNLYLWSLARHCYNLDTICEVLEAELSKLPKFDLVVVDPLFVIEGGNYGGGDGFDENNAHSVTRLITALERLTTEQDSALGLTHHCRKGNLNNADSMDRASGSGAFSRYPSVLLSLSPHEQENCAVVDATTRNFKSPAPFVFELEAPIVKARPDLDPTKLRKYGEAGKSSISSNMRALNQLPDHPLSKQNWYAKCRSAGVTESEFRQAVEDLVNSGLVLSQNGDFSRNPEAGI